MVNGLSEHDDFWDYIYQKEEKLLRNFLKDNVIEIHHIGSTSIPNLVAKPQIDIVLSVCDLERSIKQLELAGYVYKGEFNIPFRYFFGKNQAETKINLHVVLDKAPEMIGFLKFRDYMRSHPEAVQEYADLKISIADKLPSMKKYSFLNEYTLLKDDFIRNILRKSGFEGLCMRFVVHHNEEKYEHTVCSLHNYVIKSEDMRFVFYRGAEVIGYANVSPNKKINIFEIFNKTAKKYFEDSLSAYVNKK